MSEVITRGQILNASGGILNERELKKLYAGIKASEVLKDKPEALVNKAILEAFNKHREGMKAMDGDKFPFELRFVENAYQSVVDRTVKHPGKFAKPISFADRTLSELKASAGVAHDGEKISTLREALKTEQVLNAGVWWGGAALSAIGTYVAAKNIKAKDENGESHFQWSQAGITMIQAALTAACIAAGAYSLRTR